MYFKLFNVTSQQDPCVVLVHAHNFVHQCCYNSDSYTFIMESIHVPEVQWIHLHLYTLEH